MYNNNMKFKLASRNDRIVTWDQIEIDSMFSHLGVKNVTINCEAGEIATIHVEYYIANIDQRIQITNQLRNGQFENLSTSWGFTQAEEGGQLTLWFTGILSDSPTDNKNKDLMKLIKK